MVFQVFEMSWQQSILIEPLAVTVHALECAKTTGLLDFASCVVMQSCGSIGLMMIATLHAYGISRIIAIAMIRHIGLPLEELMTHTFALDEINAAMEANIAMDGIKIAIRL